MNRYGRLLFILTITHLRICIFNQFDYSLINVQVGFSGRLFSIVGPSFSGLSFQTFPIFDFSKTSGPIWSKLYTKPPWLWWIQVYVNDAPGLSLTGDNRKTVKFHWRCLKSFFSRTTGANLAKSGIKYFYIKGIQVIEIWRVTPLSKFFFYRTILNKLCLKHL